MPHRPRPIHALMTVLEETMLFMSQLLIARHPELLTAPEESHGCQAAPPVLAAHRILDAGRELSDALAGYRELLREPRG
jgi:hypothetical protein